MKLGAQLHINIDLFAAVAVVVSSSGVVRLITPAPVHMVPYKRVHNVQFERNLMHTTGREEKGEEEILFSRVSSLQKQRHGARPSMLFG